MSLIKLVCLVHDGHINPKPNSAHGSRLSVVDSTIPFGPQSITNPIKIPSAAQFSDPDPNSNIDPNPSTRTAVTSPGKCCLFVFMKQLPKITSFPVNLDVNLDTEEEDICELYNFRFCRGDINKGKFTSVHQVQCILH